MFGVKVKEESRELQGKASFFFFLLLSPLALSVYEGVRFIQVCLIQKIIQ